MTDDVRELLREGIDRLTADAEVPANLVTRARQHNRRRRQAIAGAIAAGAAAVTAAAVIVATTGSTSTGTNALHGQTITYVTTRAEQALAHIEQSKAIEIDTETLSRSDFEFTVLNLANNDPQADQPTVPKVLDNVHASRQTIWTYRGMRMWQGFSAGGTLVYSYVETSTEGYGAVYPDRTQWHTPIGGVSANVPLTCQNAGLIREWSWAKSIAKALSCHLFTLGGDQQVDGIEAVKLTRHINGGYAITYWVDPASYLPVRIDYTDPVPHAAPIVDHLDVHWRSPTKANLAALHAAEQRGAIPAGFHELPSSDFPESTPDVPGPGQG